MALFGQSRSKSSSEFIDGLSPKTFGTRFRTMLTSAGIKKWNDLRDSAVYTLLMTRRLVNKKA